MPPERQQPTRTAPPPGPVHVAVSKVVLPFSLASPTPAFSISQTSTFHTSQPTQPMTRMSTLADALKTMANASRKGKRQVLLRPTSKVIVKFLTVMQKHGYINEFEIVDDHRGGKIIVELNGRLNKCGVVSPRYNMALVDIDEFSTYLLPSRQFGFVVMTTSLGIMVLSLRQRTCDVHHTHTHRTTRRLAASTRAERCSVSSTEDRTLFLFFNHVPSSHPPLPPRARHPRGNTPAVLPSGMGSSHSAMRTPHQRTAGLLPCPGGLSLSRFSPGGQERVREAEHHVPIRSCTCTCPYLTTRETSATPPPPLP